MKKLLSLFLALALCVPLLTACHGTKGMDAFEIPEEFDLSRDYEITFWAKNDTNLTQVAIYQQAVADFESLYPNITVNLRLFTDYGRLYNDVITNIQTSTTPNVCITYPDHIATYLTGTNSVVPLDALFTDEKYGLGGSELLFDSPTLDELIPQFLSECYLNGKPYAIPYMRSSEVCYVNRTMVEKLGYTLPETLTWDFIWEVSEAAMQTDADGNYLVNGQKTLIPCLYKSTDNMMISMLYQQDAPYSTDAGDILLFNDATTEILSTVASHAGTGAFSTFKISSYPANFLNAGQCIFAIDSTAGATWMGSDAPLVDIAEDKVVDFEIEVMAIPQYDPDEPLMMSQGPSVCVFNKEDPQEVLASWLFAQFLLTNEVQIAYAQTEGYIPVTQKALDSAEYQDYLSRSGEDNDLYYWVKLEATQFLLDNIDNTFVTPVFNGSASLRDAAGYLIESATKAPRRGETVDESYLESLYEEAASLYHLDQAGVVTNEKAELGALPTASVALLCVLALTWLGIATYLLFSYRSQRRKK